MRVRESRRLLVVSHPAVVGVNQEPYLELVRRGWDATVVTPSRWRHAYSDGPVPPQTLAGMEGRLRPTPVAFAGRQQRHVYVTRPGAACRRLRPDVAFLEAESFSLAALQWSEALARARIPFGVQCAEDIDRPLPFPLARLRSGCSPGPPSSPRAPTPPPGSPAAGAPAARWSWSPTRCRPGRSPAAPPRSTFTVGFAGRLVESKGIGTCSTRSARSTIRSTSCCSATARCASGSRRADPGGDDPGRDRAATRRDGGGIRAVRRRRPALAHHPDLEEQFGRVLVEALWCGVPVVGSDSGEIPWVIEQTGGGLVFPEGDSAALAERIERLRRRPDLRAELARTGRASVERLFSMSASADALEGLLEGALDRQGQVAGRVASRA